MPRLTTGEDAKTCATTAVADATFDVTADTPSTVVDFTINTDADAILIDLDTGATIVTPTECDDHPASECTRTYTDVAQIFLTTNGFITATELSGDLLAGHIHSTGDDVTLCSPRRILDADGRPTIDVTGVNITMTAGTAGAQGGVGPRIGLPRDQRRPQRRLWCGPRRAQGLRHRRREHERHLPRRADRRHEGPHGLDDERRVAAHHRRLDRRRAQRRRRRQLRAASRRRVCRGPRQGDRHRRQRRRHRRRRRNERPRDRLAPGIRRRRARRGRRRRRPRGARPHLPDRGRRRAAPRAGALGARQHQAHGPRLRRPRRGPAPHQERQRPLRRERHAPAGQRPRRAADHRERPGLRRVRATCCCASATTSRPTRTARSWPTARSTSSATSATPTSHFGTTMVLRGRIVADCVVSPKAPDSGDPIGTCTPVHAEPGARRITQIWGGNDVDHFQLGDPAASPAARRSAAPDTSSSARRRGSTAAPPRR